MKFRASQHRGLTTPIWTPPEQQEPDRLGARRYNTCSRISGICSGIVNVPCRHGICITASPHVTSGRQAARRVIGVVWCGRNPIGHDGRSNPSQVVKEFLVWRADRLYRFSRASQSSCDSLFCSTGLLHRMARDRAASHSKCAPVCSPAPSATLAARSTLRAPWVSSMRR